jgi:hypothetical protein
MHYRLFHILRALRPLSKNFFSRNSSPIFYRRLFISHPQNIPSLKIITSLDRQFKAKNFQSMLLIMVKIKSGKKVLYFKDIGEDALKWDS